MTAAMPDPETVARAIAEDRQWRADTLQTLVEILGYMQALTEAQHGQLLALAEIRDALRIEPEPEPGEEPGPPVTVAEILDALADDVNDAARAANLIADDDAEPADPGL